MTDAVLLMAYGTPSSLDELEAYYTHIRRGRPPTPDLLAELRARYEAIGGVSPLLERTEAQRSAIQAALAGRDLGDPPVVLGFKHTAPFIEDTVAALADQGVDRAVGLVLAPHYSGFSVGQYLGRAAEAGAERGVEILPIERWHLEPTYLDFLAAGVRSALSALPPSTQVVFTAHSLPERVLAEDPYPDELGESAAAVAQRVGLAAGRWQLGWQSAGRTPEPWRGPDILELIGDLGTDPDVDGLLVCAQGFVSDHLEVVYDLDIEAQHAANTVGLAFGRTASLNADAAVMAALADRIAALLTGDG